MLPLLNIAEELQDLSFKIEDGQELTEDQKNCIDQGFIIIPKCEFANFCRRIARECGFIRNDNPLYDFVNWDYYAKKELNRDVWKSLTFDGIEYYYQEM